MASFLSTTTLLVLTALAVNGQMGGGGMGGMAGMQAMGQQMLTMMNTPGGLNGMMQGMVPKTGGQGALGQMSLVDLLSLLPGEQGQGQQMSAMLPPFAMNSQAAQWIPPYYQQKIFDALLNPKTTQAPAVASV